MYTQVVSPDGVPLLANYMTVGKETIGIATQLSTGENIESYLKMLMAENVLVVCALISAEEMAEQKTFAPFISMRLKMEKVHRMAPFYYRAGVGRTGTLLAAMAMSQTSLSLAKIINDL